MRDRLRTLVNNPSHQIRGARGLQERIKPTLFRGMEMNLLLALAEVIEK
jgi:hypothetical protein